MKTLAGLIAAIAASLIIGAVHCARRGADSPILLTRKMDPAFTAAALEHLQSALGNPALKTIFLRDRINRSIPDRPWLGRVKHANVSHQAVFCGNGSSFGWKIQPAPESSLVFSIFNSEKADLSYRVYFRAQGAQELLFERHFGGPAYEECAVPLSRFAHATGRIVFETSGSGAGAWLSPTLSAPKPAPRTVVLVVVDTLRADHLPLYGYARPTAPALSELAGSATTFRRAYSTTSWTLPAHASLFSGRDVAGHGVFQADQLIPAALPMLGETLQDAGFATAAFTGGVFVDDTYGFHRGFQSYSNAPGEVFSTDSAERVFRHFRNYHRSYDRQDFFAFLHTYQLHAPYKAPLPYRRKFNPNLQGNLLYAKNFLKMPVELFKSLRSENRQDLIDLYDGSIAYVDDALIKPLVEYLKEKNLFENALIVVCSDHGEEFYDHGGWEHGHTLYTELIHIPLVVKFPGKRAAADEAGPISIAGVPRLILGALNLERREYPPVVSPLMQSLPISPAEAQLPTRFSVIDGAIQFLYTYEGGKKLSFFRPPPRILPRESFRIADDGYTTSPLVLSSDAVNRFQAMIRTHIGKLNETHNQSFALSHELDEAIHSLGYAR